MAIIIASNSGKKHYGLVHYICDDANDVQDLPIDQIWVGSTAFVIDTGETYMFNSQKEWIKVAVEGGGGGSGLAATIQVGDVHTGMPGSPVTIQNSGTESAAIFDFSIPRGDPFQIKKVYENYTEMNNDYNNPTINIGDLVCVTNGSGVKEIWIKGNEEYEFFISLEGAEVIKGEDGAPGAKGEKGDKGDAFLYEDFTPEQLAGLKGDTGEGIDNIVDLGEGEIKFITTDGTEYTVTIPEGPKGDTGATGPAGPQGPKGDPCAFKAVYDDTQDMEDDHDNPNIDVGDLVIIKDGKVYIKTVNDWTYLFDITTTETIEGPQGPTGPQGPEGPEGPGITNIELDQSGRLIITVEGGDTYTVDFGDIWMRKVNPVGSGSMSINRKANTGIGNYSVALGYNCEASGQYSFAEGNATQALGEASHAEGHETYAGPFETHAEGCRTRATGHYSHAEGHSTEASGESAHSEGNLTQALGHYAHAEGNRTVSDDIGTHAEGVSTQALSTADHAEGESTIASGARSHAEGQSTKASGGSAHSEGYSTEAGGVNSHAEGKGTKTTADSAHAEGIGTYAIGAASHAEGASAQAKKQGSHAEGLGTTSDGDGSHAEGYITNATAQGSHSEGSNTDATGVASHAEGWNTDATGMGSHAEGYTTLASSYYAHAEGDSTQATAQGSHSEGTGTHATALSAHAEGVNTTASGQRSHAEGSGTTASGEASHAEGLTTTASGNYSHAEGIGTKASSGAQHVSGFYNIEDTENTYAEIVGGGTANTPANIRTLDWGGNATYAGKITVGTAPTNNMDVATKQYVDTHASDVEANVANPTIDLTTLKIGSTVYSVNKPTFEYIKGIRLTISDGGEYRTDKPKVEFYDDAGNLVTTPTYTSSCDKEYAGNISLNQVCSIATTDAPGAFTYVFDSNMVVTVNHLIKLTNAGSFAGDIAKSVKVELTSDGENWIELWFDPSIAWSGSANAYRIIDIKTGEVSNTLLPIVTSADNGKVLGVVNGVWDKTTVDVLPSPGDVNGSMLLTESGAWKKVVFPFLNILSGTLTGSDVNVVSKYPTNTFRLRDYIFSNDTHICVFLLKSGSSFTVFYLHEVDAANNKLVFKSFDNHTIEFVSGSITAEISTGTYT